MQNPLCFIPANSLEHHGKGNSIASGGARTEHAKQTALSLGAHREEEDVLWAVTLSCPLSFSHWVLHPQHSLLSLAQAGQCPEPALPAGRCGLDPGTSLC